MSQCQRKRSAHSFLFGGMWWVEDRVTGVAVPTRKFFGMFSWNFHTREVKGPITLWTLNCLFLLWACLAMTVVTLGWVLRATSLLPICWQALATVKQYRFKFNDIITGRHTGTTYCYYGSHCSQELHSITNVSLGLPHELHLLFCPGIAKHEADHS